MKTTIEQLRQRIQHYFQWDVEICNDEPNKLLIWHNASWGADSEKDYKRQERLIERQHYKGKIFEAWAWCDISGYDYWMHKQREPNYVSIDVIINKSLLTEKEVNRIMNKLDTFDNNLNELESYTYTK